MLQHAIHFVITNNEGIIQWLVLAVILLSLFLVGLALFGKPDKADLGLSAAELETKLKSLLERTGGEGIAAAPGTPGAAASAVGADVTKIQAEVEERNKQIAELKQAVEKAKTEGADLAPYLKQITDLKGRLAEYEIFEDDIADLSLYKDENVRLKAEIAKLKGGGPATEPAVESGPAMTAVSVSPIATPAGKDDLVAEFKAVVDQQKKAPTPDAPGDGDDLMTEFAASLEEDTSAPASPEGASAGAEDDTQVDADKMLAEMAAMEGLGAADKSALEEEADMDKMAAEASKLLGKP